MPRSTSKLQPACFNGKCTFSHQIELQMSIVLEVLDIKRTISVADEHVTGTYEKQPGFLVTLSLC